MVILVKIVFQSTKIRHYIYKYSIFIYIVSKMSECENENDHFDHDHFDHFF